MEGDPSVGGPRECSPVGVELEGQADEIVAVGLDEYSFDPVTLEVQAGTVTFEARNAGNEEHELAFLPGGGDVPLTDDGAPDEDALAEAGAFELEAFGPGQTCNATYAPRSRRLHPVLHCRGSRRGDPSVKGDAGSTRR